MILDHDVFVQYPSVIIDLYYISKLRDQFDGSLLEGRVKILGDEVLAVGYTEFNVSKVAVIDTARRKKIHYFVTNVKYRNKLINKIVSYVKRNNK